MQSVIKRVQQKNHLHSHSDKIRILIHKSGSDIRPGGLILVPDLYLPPWRRNVTVEGERVRREITTHLVADKGLTKVQKRHHHPNDPEALSPEPCRGLSHATQTKERCKLVILQAGQSQLSVSSVSGMKELRSINGSTEGSGDSTIGSIFSFSWGDSFSTGFVSTSGTTTTTSDSTTFGVFVTE